MLNKNFQEKIKKQNILDFKNFGGYDMYTYKFSNDIDLDKKSKKENVLEQLKKIDSKYSQSKFNENSVKEIDNSVKEIETVKSVNSNKTFKNSLDYEEVLKAVAENENNELQAAEKEFNSKIFKMENELALLEQQKNMALASFDISYASKIITEIEKINSSIAQTRKTYLEQKQENDNSIENSENIEDIKHMEKFEILQEYLKEFPKQQAIAELEDERYKNELGKFYDILFAELSSR